MKSYQIQIPIIKYKLTKETKIFRFIIGFLLIVFFISVYFSTKKEPPYYLNIVILILLITTQLIHAFRSYSIKNFEEIGNILFDNQGFSVKHEELITHYSFEDFKHIKVSFKETADDTFYSQNIASSMKNKEGVNNWITITDNSGNKVKHQVHLKNIPTKRVINKILSGWPREKWGK